MSRLALLFITIALVAFTTTLASFDSITTDLDDDLSWGSAWNQRIASDINIHHDDTNLNLSGPLSVPSLADIRVQAKLAAAAYCVSKNSQALENWKCKACTSDVTMHETKVWHITEHGTGVYVGYDSKHDLIRVSFRGSSNLQNWFTNLNFLKAPFPGGGEVHNGFKRAYISSRIYIIPEIAALRQRYPAASVSITGHSLGAALALLAVLDLKNGLFTVTNVAGINHVSSELFPEELPFSTNELELLGATTTAVGVSFPIALPFVNFGQPRVGNAAFAAYVNKELGANYIRVTHRHDPVPRVPIQAQGFAHPPLEIYFPEQGNSTKDMKVCSYTMTEDPTCIISPLINVSISDHLIGAGINMSLSVDDCS